MQPHKCDETCVCWAHVEPQPLIYHRPSGGHACSDPECTNALGMGWDQTTVQTPQ